MSKPFKKGDLVTLFQNQDSQGTITIEDMMVYSCGAKLMVLVTEDGAHFQKTNFYHDTAEANRLHTRVLPRMTAAEAEAEALAMGAAHVAYQRAHYHQRIEQWGDNLNFRRSMERGLAELHEPRVLRREA